MNIEPLGAKILVQQFEAEMATLGGILLPEKAKHRPLKGKVIRTGPGKTLEDGTTRPMTIKVGDVILFGQYAAGTTIEIEGKEYILMNEEDVLALENH